MSQSSVFLVVAFDHPLQAVESVADRIAAALCCQGVNAAACSLPRDLEKLASIPRSTVNGILSMGSLPLIHRIGEQWIWEHFKCPVSVYLLDAIIYDLARVPVFRHFLNAARGTSRLSLTSPEAGYANWLREAVGVRWDHVPFGHFAQIKPGAPPVTPQNRLCVVGTIGQELGGSPVNETLPELLDRIGVTSNDLRGRIQEALLSHDADDMPARAFSEALGWHADTALAHASTLATVDSWIKRHRRLTAVRSLRGYPVDFFGTGWKEVMGDVPDFRYVGTIKHQDIATLSRHYRGLVNFDPNWQHGVHDRVYTACAMGTSVITNENSAIQLMKLPSELVLTYRSQCPNLGDTLESAGLLHGAPEQRVPNTSMLMEHSWTQRITPWLAAMPTCP